jgi:hypothetical protein
VPTHLFAASTPRVSYQGVQVPSTHGYLPKVPLHPDEHAEHAAELVLPAMENGAATAHATHTEAPDRLYRPAEQMDPVALVDPAGQTYPAAAVQLVLHTVARAVLLLHVPAAQLVHVRAPARLYRPAGQRDAVAFVDATGQKYPAVQALQKPAPARLYWPAGHMDAVALVDPAGQKYPAVQLVLHTVARAALLLHVPAAQLVHVGAPARLYRPAGQRDAVAFVDATGQKYPAVQALQEPAPAGLYWPAGHTDAVALVDPARQEYPALHGLQAPAPNRLNRPAGQVAHAVDFGRLYCPAEHNIWYDRRFRKRTIGPNNTNTK